MREIKFRAWATHWKLMSEPLNIKNGLSFFYFKEADAPHVLSVSTTTLEIIQSTGLKDKNGVEIYEMGIIKVYNEKSRFYNDMAKVVFRNGTFMLKSIDFEDEHIEFFINHPFSLYNQEDYEVIGNIYENEELPK